MPLLLSLALVAPPGPLDAQVRLDPVRPGAVTGVASAPEGVLRVELYVLPAPLPVATFVPPVPLGDVAFSLPWPADRSADLRVVATTALRGVSADARFVLPAAPVAAPPSPSRTAGRVAPPPAPVVARRPVPAGVYPGGYETSLPYAPPLPAPGGAPPPARTVAAASEPGREGGFAVATGLLLLVCTAHAHRLMTTEDAP